MTCPEGMLRKGDQGAGGFSGVAEDYSTYPEAVRE
jgi:hypothetical protein